MKGHTKPIQRDTASIRKQVTDNLRQSILYGQFEPGQRLIETDLCESLGVSRPLLREALQHLAAESLIKIVLHRGPVVASLTLEEALNIYSVRKAIESLAAEEFARRATTEDMAQLLKWFDAFQGLRGSAQVREMLRAKDRLNDVLIEGSKNPEIGDILYRLKNRTALLRRKTLSRPGRPEALHNEIAALVRALKARDPELAARRCAVHIDNATRAMIEGFAEVEVATVPKKKRSKGKRKATEAKLK